MKRDLSLPGVVRRARTLDMDWNFMFGDQKFQFIEIILSNAGGVLQHSCRQSAITPAKGIWAATSDKFRGLSAVGVNTPTLGAGTGFANGIGISGNLLVIDTVQPLDIKTIMALNECQLSYYNGNNTRVIPIAGITSVNVLGSVAPRFTIGLWNALNGAAVNIAVAWLPTNTQQANFTWWGTLP